MSQRRGSCARLAGSCDAREHRVWRRVQVGVASSDLMLSARVTSNASVFADVLRLHVPAGSRVAEVTYGQGAFWRAVPAGEYRLTPSDLKTGVDCTRLPYADDSFDAVVLDPTYMEGLFRPATGQHAGGGTHAAFRSRYSTGAASEGGPRYQETVVDLYRRAEIEAYRVLRRRGIFIVKCQDEVSAARQRLTHAELVNEVLRAVPGRGLARRGAGRPPGVSRIKRQLHARKNHSYFLVFVAR